MRTSVTEIIKIEDIQSKILTIRNQQVILDKDLAQFYNVKPIRLREQIKRNPKRFPSDFIFQLSDDEVKFLLSQNAIPTKQSLGGSLPFVFTEQGVAAASAVLTSDRAIEINIMIMRAFVAMRHFLLNNAQVFQRLDSLELKQINTDKKLDLVLDAFNDKDNIPKEGIFFEGQVFDAYKFACDLIRKAKKSVILIDNYIDDTVLDILTKSNKNVKAIIYTKNISKQLGLDLSKHNEQYPTIEIKEFNFAHDRFLLIDDTIYHIGASLKDLGKKWFAFSKMNISALDMLKKLEKI